MSETVTVDKALYEALEREDRLADKIKVKPNADAVAWWDCRTQVSLLRHKPPTAKSVLQRLDTFWRSLSPYEVPDAKASVLWSVVEDARDILAAHDGPTE